MTNDLIFWRNWAPLYKYLLYFSIALALVALVFCGISIIAGEGWNIEWEVETEAEKLLVPLERFQQGIFEFDIQADAYVLQERFFGSQLDLQGWAVYLHLAFFAIALVIALSVIPSMQTLWYAGAMSLVIYVLATLKTEQLIFLGQDNRLLLGIMLLLYLPASIYFHAFRQDLSLLIRFFTFAASTLLIGLLIAFGSQVSDPFWYVSSYGMPAYMILAVIFILMVSTEIVRGLLYISTSGGSDKKGAGVRHFTIITFIYLLNLVLVYLYNTKKIDWDFIYLNEFLVLLISAVLGFWGYHKKEEMLKGILHFSPFGALLYFAMAVICFSTIGYAFAMANDPIIEMFEDAIIYTHISMGVAFFIYIIINFYALLHENQAVHRVVFNPRRMPYALATVLGLIAILAFFLQSSMLPYNQAIGGYHNALGDLYRHHDDYFLAEQYYKEGRVYAYRNHRSNYSLASLSEIQNDESAALYYYKEAFQKQPTPYAYVNAAAFYQKSDMFFDAVFTLKKGRQQFPKSGPVLNNLAQLYMRTQDLDSTLFYLDQALNDQQNEEHTHTNLSAIVAKGEITLPADSLAQAFEDRQYPPLKSNLAILLSQQKYQLPLTDWPEFIHGPVLNLYEFTYIYDYTLNQVTKGDTSLLTQLDSWKQTPENLQYGEQLDVLSALAYFYAGNTQEAILLLESLARQSNQQPQFYYNLLGKLMLKRQAPLKAAEYFKNAAKMNVKEARLNRAIALTNGGQNQQAIEAWQQVPKAHEQISSLMQQMLSQDTFSLENHSDAVRYEYARLQLHRNQWKRATEAIEMIEDNTYQAQALTDALGRALNQQNIAKASEFSAALDKLTLPDPPLRKKKRLAQLWLRAETQQWDQLDRQLDRQDSAYAPEILYAKARLAEHQDPKSARPYYEQLKRDPLFENGVIQAARYFRQVLKDEELAYETLQEAVQFNPYSAKIRQAYILNSLELGLEKYARQAYSEMQTFSSEAQLAEFEPQYRQALEKLENERENW